MIIPSKSGSLELLDSLFIASGSLEVSGPQVIVFEQQGKGTQISNGVLRYTYLYSQCDLFLSHALLGVFFQAKSSCLCSF